MSETPGSPIRRRVGRIALGVLIALCAVLAFGINGADESAFRGFDEAASRWQTNPEFRAVAIEYCIRGSRALRTRPLWMPAGRLILALRSLPLLPKDLAVNSTSQAHYRNFSNGPLCAYLYLCGEQSVSGHIGAVETTAQLTSPTDADYRAVLDSFNVAFHLCKDVGALRSVASLIADTQARQPFAIRENVGPRLLPHIRAIARELQVPEETELETDQQQLAVLDRLDSRVLRDDPELWRTKQLSDFCGGVWAQVFSPPYQDVLGGVIALHRFGSAFLVVMLAGLIVRGRDARRDRAAAAGTMDS